MASFPLPLPPFEEQQRIVAKLEELIIQCDQLKSDIVKAKRQQQKLADVLIEHALVP